MTISLPTAMLAKIEHARQVEDRTRSEFVRQAIRVYLAHSDPERLFAENGDGTPDKVTGGPKERAGTLADGDERRHAGKPDQTDGRVKDAAAGTVIDRVRDAVRDGKDRI